jgi:hypothetical protein
MPEAALKVVAKLAGVAPVTGLSRLEWIRERRRGNQREDPRDHQGIGLHSEYSCGQSAPKEIE